MKKTETFNRVMSFFSKELADEINRVILSLKGKYDSVEEVRLRGNGRSALVICGRNVPISYRVGTDEIRQIFKRVCDMALFAHRDEIASGYVSAGMGIRVGVAGKASYEGGTLVGIDGIATLVFRFPCNECDIAPAVYERWRRAGRRGLLICSRAGTGKTTLLRSLARLIGSGRDAMRVVAVDERCEFDVDAYSDCFVDILSGYKRDRGIEIALRTLSAEVIMVDEISSRADADAMVPALGAGTCVIATAHGDSIEDVMKREYIKRLVSAGIFENYVTVFRSDGGFGFDFSKL